LQKNIKILKSFSTNDVAILSIGGAMGAGISAGSILGASVNLYKGG
jgi:hypothetical protein